MRAGVAPHQRVLDVGSGTGGLLDRRAKAGFRHLRGIDPFLKQAMTTPAGVPLACSRIEDEREPQDTIMFNHSLEHVPDPLAALRHAARLLAPDGRIIVRIPTPSSTVFAQ